MEAYIISHIIPCRLGRKRNDSIKIFCSISLTFQLFVQTSTSSFKYSTPTPHLTPRILENLRREKEMEVSIGSRNRSRSRTMFMVVLVFLSATVCLPHVSVSVSAHQCKAWLVQSIPTDMPHLARVSGVLSTGNNIIY